MHLPHLPLPNAALKAAYLGLTADIDSLVSSLISERFSNKLNCRPGCMKCCMKFSVLPVEAAFLFGTINTLQLKLKRIDDDTNCALLSGDRCSIYDIRPIICRTQGLPIAYIDEDAGSIEVSACQLNFTDDYQLSKEDLFFMDQFNQRLAELNMEYCNATGLDPQKRIALADLVSCKLT